MEFDKRVAIIGIALRVPDANNMDELWQLIENGSCTSKKVGFHLFELCMFD